EGSGTISVVPPPDAHTTFTGCTGSGPVSGSLPTCSVTVTSAFNGRWQKIDVSIPDGYTCDDGHQSGCWVRLKFNYGAGNDVHDVTAWSASLEGDPVRLVE